MEEFAVAVFPVAKTKEWREFIESISTGERADDHRRFLRRLGVKREHIHHQNSRAGDVMVLVWEGVGQSELAGAMGDFVQNPQSEHERYLATHVIPEIHGVDPNAGPPPNMERVATIET